ncbi:hypothetical protein ACE1CB_21320 [Aerosakkonema sp. BLCC-F2]
MTEMFNPDYTESKYDFTPDTPAAEILANYIFTPQNMMHSCVGFLLHRCGARFGNWPDLWSLLEQDKHLAAISLRRQNLLRRYLSVQLMKNQDLEGNPPASLHFDKDLLIRDFQKQEAKIAEFDARFSDHPLITVTYEDLCDRYTETMGRIQSFLNLTPVNLEPGTKKRATPALAQIVANYTELKREFADTKWFSFFDD